MDRSWKFSSALRMGTAILSTLVVQLTAMSFAAEMPSTSSGTAAGASLSADDLRTAYGSLRVGRRASRLYAILTATNTNIELTPNVWTGDTESKQWNDWLSGFDDDLYSKWLASDPGDGQETVMLHILPSGFSIDSGHFLGNAPNSNQQKFESAMQEVVAKTLKAEGAMPTTKNPLKEVRLALTFMSDSSVVPRYGNRELGFMATVPASSNKLVVYGRPNKEGLTTGIQIIGEGDGDINIVDPDVFNRRCAELAAP